MAGNAGAMIACPYCKTQNRPDAIFCDSCGAALSATAGPTQAAAVRRPLATGQLPAQTMLAGRYLILQRVGQGGMAAVYRGTDTKRNRAVAIKEMSQDGLSPSEIQEAIESFKSEANLLMKLDHPNLPAFYQQFSENARHYLVMEYVEGRTLEQIQATDYKGGIVSEALVIEWAKQLCDALEYLHTRTPPIIFRDLKPANIMVTPDNKRVKLIDFGIARVFSPTRTRDTQALGTPGYAPPEQYGKAQTDARADIYALGCTLYQLLSGYDTARTPFALPPLHTRNERVSPHIQLAIEKATRLDRDQRFRSMGAFKEALTRPDALYFLPGEPARSLNDIIALSKKYPQEGQRLLYTEHIGSWLTGWGRRDPKAAQAALAAQAAIRAHPNDRAAGLASFLIAAQAGSPGATAARQVPPQAARPQANQANRAAGARAGNNANNANTRTGIKIGFGHNGQFPGMVINTPLGQFPVGPNLTGGQNNPNIRGNVGAQRAATAQRAAAATATATGGLIKVQPGSIDFGAITLGQRAVKTFLVTGQAGARVNGTVAVDPPTPWLSVDRTTFNGSSTLITVTAETSLLGKTGREVGIIEIRSGGSQQTVSMPIFIEVTPAPFVAGGAKKQAATAAATKTAGAKAQTNQTNQTNQTQPKQQGSFRRFFTRGRGAGVGANGANKTGQAQTATTIRRAGAVLSPRQALRASFGWRFWLSLLLPFIVVEPGMLLMERLADPRILKALPWHAPSGALAFALLALAALVAWFASLSIGGGLLIASRRMTSALWALAGFGMALLFEGHWLFSMRSLALLTGADSTPIDLQLVLPAVVSVTSAIGAHPLFSQWTVACLRAFARFTPLRIVLAILVGAWGCATLAARLGAMLLGAHDGFLITVLGAVGLATGIALGIALNRPMKTLFTWLASPTP